MQNTNTRALIVIDLQVDFCPGGALAVSGGDEIVAEINSLIVKKATAFGTGAENDISFKKIILTADWHPSEHSSFASVHGLEPYKSVNVNGELVTLWPDHCVEGSPGAAFHPDLNTAGADLIIRKGRSAEMDSYSAFYENDRKTPTGLAGYLKDHGIEKVYLCGLALDWCVYFSAIDSLGHEFETFVITDLSRAVDSPSGYAKLKEKEMREAGISLIYSSNLQEYSYGAERR